MAFPSTPAEIDVVAAYGQAAGAAFTALAVIVAVWLGWRDRRWRRADQADRDASQARLITVDTRPAMDFDINVFRVLVTNASAYPIFNVRIADLKRAGRPTQEWKEDFRSSDAEGGTRRVLQAGGSLTFHVYYVDESRTPLLEQKMEFGHDYVTFEFTDAAGLLWSRRDTEAPRRRLEHA